MKPYKLLLFMVVVAAFHTVSYYLVNHINSSRPPDIFYNLQVSIDQYIPYLGWACLPSYHVTLTVLPAYISFFTLRPGFLKALSITLAALITVSTLTLKEHYILDVGGGILLGLIAGYLWRGRGNNKK